MTEEQQSVSSTAILPVLPLRDVVVFPHLVIPLFVGRAKSIEALERAMEADKKIFLATQRDEGDDDGRADVHEGERLHGRELGSERPRRQAKSTTPRIPSAVSSQGCRSPLTTCHPAP